MCVWKDFIMSCVIWHWTRTIMDFLVRGCSVRIYTFKCSITWASRRFHGDCDKIYEMRIGDIGKQLKEGEDCKQHELNPQQVLGKRDAPPLERHSHLKECYLKLYICKICTLKLISWRLRPRAPHPRVFTIVWTPNTWVRYEKGGHFHRNTQA